MDGRQDGKSNGPNIEFTSREVEKSRNFSQLPSNVQSGANRELNRDYFPRPPRLTDKHFRDIEKLRGLEVDDDGKTCEGVLRESSDRESSDRQKTTGNLRFNEADIEKSEDYVRKAQQ